MKDTFILHCPIRGILKAASKSADGLLPSEEYRRVEAIKYLLKQGYPKENFKVEAVIKKFGNSGRNSFRVDFAILDVPISTIDTSNIDELLNHAVLLSEVKRNNSNYDYVRNTQVKPMLDFAKVDKCVGLYWDNVEQRVFWQEWEDDKKRVCEGALALLPRFGNKINVSPLTFKDTKPSDALLDVFARIEDILHQASIDPEQRYEVILQLLLAKLYDEHAHMGRPNSSLGIQDFSVLGTDPKIVEKTMNDILKEAVAYYEKHLPKRISKKFEMSPNTTIEVLKILAPIRVVASKREVIQTFYMKFAKDLYRWDLAQYFTPITVTDFIIEVLNPQFGEHLKDPACGSADFLTAAFHRGRDIYPNYADCIWGADNSTNAVQVSVLNMLLNGDGKTNIRHEDSLENIDKYLNTYNILVCNPPFGTKIVEKRQKVLKKYDLGHDWDINEDGKWKKDDKKLVEQQETGILFTEACVLQTKPNGRIGIILPNGYLGNRSKKYRVFREWLLRNCKVVSICSFPRFTFKTSGADVSASVVFLQKRETPLNSPHDDVGYHFNVEMIENVGWDVGNKRAQPVYKRNAEDGSYIIGENGEKLLDADFNKALTDLRNSIVAEEYSWLNVDDKNDTNQYNGWSISIDKVLGDMDLTLDPKRFCRKATTLRGNIQKHEHFKLGDIIDIIPQSMTSNGKRTSKKANQLYKYVEIQDIGCGEYVWTELRGWQLPDRAKHFAEPDDLYLGSIWGSVAKWCMIGSDCDGIVVTNGCHRVRMKKGKEGYLLDFIAFLCTDAYATQMRAFARGSDGLAEVSEEDLKEVLVPVVIDENVRQELKLFIKNLLAGKRSLTATVAKLISSGEWMVPLPEKRPNHTVLV